MVSDRNLSTVKADADASMSPSNKQRLLALGMFSGIGTVMSLSWTFANMHPLQQIKHYQAANASDFTGKGGSRLESVLIIKIQFSIFHHCAQKRD